MRRFEQVEGTSSKFWAVQVQGHEVVVRFGRIGTDGQERRKDLGDPAAARAEADKLVRQKLAKGYREVTSAGTGEKAAKASPKKAAKASPKKAAKPKPSAGATASGSQPPRAEPSIPRRGTVPRREGFAFTPELDALWARGFPRMFVLADAGSDKADARLVRKALDDVDPVLPVFLSRRAASRFLHGYAVGKTWGWSAKARATVYDEAKVAAVEAASKSDDEAGLDVLETILQAQLPHGTETYPWRVQHAVWLAEALHGTEAVIERVVAHLVRVGKDRAAWGERGDPGRTNNHANELAAGLAVMRLRTPPARWKALVAPLRGCTSAALKAQVSIIAAVLDDEHEPPKPMATHFAIARRDPEPLVTLVRKESFAWWPTEIAYLLGPEWLATAPGRDLKRHPKWKQLRLVDELGTVDHEEVARVIGWLASGSSARKPASAWLVAHPELARLAARRMEAIPGEGEVARMMHAVLDGEPPPKVVPMTAARLRKEIAAIFGGLTAAMRACEGDSDRETAVLQGAFDRYCEVRAAAGDVTPEAYFTHHLEVFESVDEPTAQRWIDLAVDVASG